MKIIKIKREEFKAGFAKGIVIGLIVLFLCVEILTFIGTEAPLLVTGMILIIWLLPSFLIYREIRTNSERVGFMASHYCVFLLGLVMLLLWLIR